MKDFGIVYSSVSPKSIKIDEKSVWVSENVESYSETNEDFVVEGFKYSLKQYPKDEYILSTLQQLEVNQEALIISILEE